MRVLVGGGRNYGNWEHVSSVLGAMHAENPFECVINGGADGADYQARFWAIRNNVEVITEPADWEKHGRAAGPIRNERMIEEHAPALVIAFPGGRGTEDMKERARAHKIPVFEAKPGMAKATADKRSTGR